MNQARVSALRDAMKAVEAIIYRRPVATYFALAFTISWGGILVVAGPGGIPGTTDQTKTLLPFAVLAMLVGPSVASVLMNSLIYGRAGRRNLLSRLLRWRVDARWYAVALLTAPLLVTMVLLSLSLASPMFLPIIFTSGNKGALLLAGFGYGLAAGFFEELGWTGFAVPGLRSRFSILATGLIVGTAWGAWHFLVALWGSGSDSGAFSLLLFLPQFLFYVCVLPAYRVLMVWVYGRTGSLPVAMLMHASLTASLPLALAPPATGILLSLSYLVLAAALWGIVAMVASVGNGPEVKKERRTVHKVLLVCGIVSSLLYVATVVLSPAMWEEYNSTSQTVSELIAIDAPTRPLVTPLFMIYSMLVVAFGVGVRLTAKGKQSLRLAAAGLAGKEILGVVVMLVFPIHLRGVEPTITDTMHGALTFVGLLFILLALAAGAAAFGGRFRLYSIATIVLFVVGGFLTAIEAPKLKTNLSTPWMGFWERVNIFAYMLWVMVLSVVLLRTSEKQAPKTATT
jgi:membrane protease YdiL (CAAX protease family)